MSYGHPCWFKMGAVSCSVIYYPHERVGTELEKAWEKGGIWSQIMSKLPYRLAEHAAGLVPVGPEEVNKAQVKRGESGIPSDCKHQPAFDRHG